MRRTHTDADGHLGDARRLVRDLGRRGDRLRRAERLREDDLAAPDRRDLQARPAASLDVDGSVGSLLELGAGFHPDFTGRENIFLSGAIYGMKRATMRGPPRRDHRVRRARAVHRPARAHVLVGHVHAPRIRDRRAPGRRDPAARRGVRGRRRGVPAQVRRQGARVQAAGRNDRLRLARGLGRRAPVRPRRAPASRRSSSTTARPTRRFVATRRCSPTRRRRPSAEAGLREWGTGEVRVTGARLEGADGDGAA